MLSLLRLTGGGLRARGRRHHDPQSLPVFMKFHKWLEASLPISCSSDSESAKQSSTELDLACYLDNRCYGVTFFPRYLSCGEHPHPEYPCIYEAFLAVGVLKSCEFRIYKDTHSQPPIHRGNWAVFELPLRLHTPHCHGTSIAHSTRPSLGIGERAVYHPVDTLESVSLNKGEDTCVVSSQMLSDIDLTSRP